MVVARFFHKVVDYLMLRLYSLGHASEDLTSYTLLRWDVTKIFQLW